MKNKFIYCLTLLSLLSSCNSVESIEKCFYTHEQDILELQKLANELYHTFDFKFAYARDLEPFSLSFILDTNKGITVEMDKKTQKIISISNCRNCTKSQEDIFADLENNELVEQILIAFIKTKGKAISINNEGLFIAYGSSLTQNPFYSDLESGIFLPFVKEFHRSRIIKKINENVFVYETVVHASTFNGKHGKQLKKYRALNQERPSRALQYSKVVLKKGSPCS